jgi:hypothetical protein
LSVLVCFLAYRSNLLPDVLFVFSITFAIKCQENFSGKACSSRCSLILYLLPFYPYHLSNFILV